MADDNAACGAAARAELDVNLSDFAFGTASVGSRITYSRFVEMADLARQAGLCRFDTAPQYGRGLAQVFLQRYLQARPDFAAKASTKLGRLPVGDAKSILVVLAQREPRHALRLLSNSRGAAADFSRANLLASHGFALQSLSARYIDSVFLHASPLPALALVAAGVLRELCSDSLMPGVAEPCAEDLQWLQDHGAERWAIQVSATDLLKDSALQAFPGTVWINSIIRHARATGLDLEDTMAQLQAARSRDRVFVVGFNHTHLFDAFAAL